MHPIESHLLKIGYEVKQKSERNASSEYSSLGTVSNTYIKDGHKSIEFGLHECGYPPTWIYPRPSVFVSETINNEGLMLKTYKHLSDAEMLGLMNKLSPEMLYDMMTTNKTIKL